MKGEKFWRRVLPILIGCLFLQLGILDCFGADLFPIPKLVPYRVQKKWGIYNTKGFFLVEPQFEEVQPYHDGVSIVKVKKGEYGIIDTLGKFLYRTNKILSGESQFGLIQQTDSNGMCQYINKYGKEIIGNNISIDLYGFNFNFGYGGVLLKKWKSRIYDFEGRFICEVKYPFPGIDKINENYFFCCSDIDKPNFLYSILENRILLRIGKNVSRDKLLDEIRNLKMARAENEMLIKDILANSIPFFGYNKKILLHDSIPDGIRFCEEFKVFDKGDTITYSNVRIINSMFGGKYFFDAKYAGSDVIIDKYGRILLPLKFNHPYLRSDGLIQVYFNENVNYLDMNLNQYWKD